MPITKNNLTQLRHEIEARLKDLEAPFEIKVGGIKYGENDATVKLTALHRADSGEVFNPDEAAFKSLAKLYDFEPEDFGKKFTVRGTTYKITGLASRRPKYPISALGPQGGRYKFPADVVLRALGRQGS